MNAFEQKLKAELEAENPDCHVLRNGEPDFWIVERSSGKIRKAVEGKAKGDVVHRHQDEMHRALVRSGIPVDVRYEWGNGTFARPVELKE